MNGTPPVPLTIDQLIALCDEINALARSGVPLERGLLTAASELPGRLGQVATEIGERGESGQSLEQIVQSDRLQMPAVLRAMILAGTRSGKLTVALEGIASSTRRMAELRRSVIEAAIYPLMVLMLVSGLCLVTLSVLSETFSATMNQQGIRGGPRGLAVMEFLGNWMWLLGPIALVAFLAWVVFTRQASALQPRRMDRWMIWVPWTRRLCRHARLATFLDVLALLLEQDVPVNEALTLAGQASGDESLQRDANRLAAAAQRGEALTADASVSVIPALVRWQLTSQTSQSELVASLKANGNAERRRAEILAEWLRVQLPVILTFGVGGAATLVYALAVMFPWYSMLGRMAESGVGVH